MRSGCAYGVFSKAGHGCHNQLSVQLASFAVNKKQQQQQQQTDKQAAEVLIYVGHMIVIFFFFWGGGGGGAGEVTGKLEKQEIWYHDC